MRVFKEEQAFRQWWILLILGIALIGTSFPLFRSYKNSDLSISGFIGFGLVVLVLILFWTLRLHTKIDSTGIKTSFEPLNFFRKKFKWNEISKCYVRKYAPIREYGGWGIRGSGKSKAYNVSGNIGIQIITKDQKKFLIGTNKPEEAKRVLKRYQDKL